MRTWFRRRRQVPSHAGADAGLARYADPGSARQDIRAFRLSLPPWERGTGRTRRRPELPGAPELALARSAVLLLDLAAGVVLYANALASNSLPVSTSLSRSPSGPPLPVLRDAGREPARGRTRAAGPTARRRPRGRRRGHRPPGERRDRGTRAAVGGRPAAGRRAGAACTGQGLLVLLPLRDRGRLAPARGQPAPPRGPVHEPRLHDHGPAPAGRAPDLGQPRLHRDDRLHRGRGARPQLPLPAGPGHRPGRSRGASGRPSGGASR